MENEIKKDEIKDSDVEIKSKGHGPMMIVFDIIAVLLILWFALPLVPKFMAVNMDSVEVGQKGLLITNPFFWGDVKRKEVGPGTYFIWPGNKLLTFNNLMQLKVETIVIQGVKYVVYLNMQLKKNYLLGNLITPDFKWYKITMSHRIRSDILTYMEEVNISLKGERVTAEEKILKHLQGKFLDKNVAYSLLHVTILPVNQKPIN